ncbi:M48 family metalloprotease [Lysobacter sp. FW306-1B-D06B]|uniref:M48 family metalloprotease n=1 Tax=Lysobacter sp. FW306-1B-D06B TaxID=3140250 RepID=UPI003140018D
MKRLISLFAACTLCIGVAHAGKLGALLGNDKMLEAGGDAVKGLTMSSAEVSQLSAQSVVQMDKDNTVAPASSQYAKRLARLTKGMEHEDGLDLNFKVYMVKDVNAFATPDGSVRVFAGLMDLMPNDNELMAVIGHEIGHVRKGHSLERFKTTYLTSAARKGAAAAGGNVGALASSQLGALGEAVVKAKFSRGNETEADKYGVDFLLRHNLDPNGAVEAMKKLGGAQKTGLLDSHPASAQRAEALQKYIAGKKR